MACFLAGYDEDAALQAALEASAREHAVQSEQWSNPTSFGAGAQPSAPDQEDCELQKALKLSKQTSAPRRYPLAQI